MPAPPALAAAWTGQPGRSTARRARGPAARSPGDAATPGAVAVERVLAGAAPRFAAGRAIDPEPVDPVAELFADARWLPAVLDAAEAVRRGWRRVGKQVTEETAADRSFGRSAADSSRL